MSAINCSVCGFAMEPGLVSINDTSLGFFVFGSSIQHLLWQNAPAAKKRKLLSSSEQRRALKCERCGTLIIPHLDPQPFDKRPK